MLTQQTERLTSIRLFQRLKNSRNKHHLVTLEGGDHHLSDYEHRYGFLRKTEIFFKKHIGGED